MAYSSDSSIDDLILAYDSMFVNSCCTLAATVLLMYECMITFDHEVEYFWKRTFPGASALYIFNKYLALVVSGLSLATYFPVFTDKSCANTQNAILSFQSLQFLPWAIFSMLRTYALTKHRTMSILVFMLSIVPLSINLAQYVVPGINGGNDPIFGCVEDVPIPVDMFARFVIISRASLITADVMLVFITLWNTPKRNILSQIHRPSSLHSILLRDGTIYFVVLVVLNALHLTFSLISVFGNGTGSYVSIFTGPGTAILVSRFLSHLQETGRRTLRVDLEHPLHISEGSAYSTPSFVRTVVPPSSRRKADSDSLREWEA